MSRNDCYSCGPCGGICDKCSAECCINNMESHHEIYRLKDEFNNKVDYAIQNLYDKCCEIKNNLWYNYNINVQISDISDKIMKSYDFLNNLQTKENEIQNFINNINNEIAFIKNQKTNEIDNINKIHEKKMYNMNTKFEKEIKKYEINNLKYDNDFKTKNKIINDLKDEKSKINIDIDSIVKSIVEEERLKAEKGFIINKNEIDNKYNCKKYDENELTFNKNELELKKEYLNEIEKLKAYSDKIPNYNNWISLYGLNKYI